MSRNIRNRSTEKLDDDGKVDLPETLLEKRIAIQKEIDDINIKISELNKNLSVKIRELDVVILQEEQEKKQGSTLEDLLARKEAQRQERVQKALEESKNNGGHVYLCKLDALYANRPRKNPYIQLHQ